MTHNKGKPPVPGMDDDHLEPYRRMVEMQRQIIELTRKHENMKRQNEQLREQVAHEIALFCRPRRGLAAWVRLLAIVSWRRFRQLTLSLKRAVDTSDIFPSSSQSTET